MFRGHVWTGVVLQLLVATIVRAAGTCESVEIRAPQDFQRLRDCSVVVGHVHIVNVRLSAMPNAHLLATAVEEITDYLLVYRVEGLTSLGTIFPKLVLVRGQRLLFGQYGLAVIENRNLLEIGLFSLLRVQRGSIRIEANPTLCFADTVNWISILDNSTKQHFSLKDNKPANHCPRCVTAERADENTFPKNCWNIVTHQRKPVSAVSRRCPHDCGVRGCDAGGECCSSHCLTACSPINCRHCTGFLKDGKCVEECSFPFFQLNKRECVSDGECRRLGMIPHGHQCVAGCPKGYFPSHDGRGVVTCSLNCTGNFVVNSISDLDGLADCTELQGSLTIELTEIQERIIGDLEQTFGKVREITGYLKITRSPPLLSLSFLRNLHTISGEKLIDNKYALYVVDNHHLEQIWSTNQKVAILNGHVYFHLNPRLCYEKILQLEPHIRSSPKIPIMYASPNSNGERVICGSSVHELNATIEDLNSTAARIKVQPMSANDKEVLLGYIYYYKVAPVRNVTIYDGRHGCGRDNWHMDISPSRNIRHVIGNLKPYTQYAYFVKTLTLTDYHNQIDAYSKIQYFRTLPARPGPVAKLYYRSLSANEIMVHWWPPREPNGLVKKYILSYEALANEVTQNLTDRTYDPSMPSKYSRCQCPITSPESSGPFPEDENYYNKQQLIYDEALTNLIYVPLPKEEFEKRFKNRNVSESYAESILANYREKMELDALAEQDTGIQDFPIVKPPPVCKHPHASIQHQLENSCKAMDHFEGVELPGGTHSHTLIHLLPEVTYRLSIRACVDGIANNCGPETVILAETVSKRMETFLQGIKKYY